jgi:nucleoside-diphosphate-sugar epimerase
LRLDVVLNDLVASAAVTGKVVMKSDGTPWRPIVHIRDIIAAAVAILDAPREAVHNEAFNVGRTEENYRIRELAEIVAETVPGCRIEYAPGGGPDKRCYRINCDKLPRLVPAFQPQWDARKGAKELYEAYKAVGLTSSDLETGRYIRLKNLQKLMSAGSLDATLHWTAKAFA